MRNYLTFAEYQEMGGMLEQTLFDVLERDVEAIIDTYTLNRLWVNTEYPERVKECAFRLIDLVNTEYTAMTVGQTGAGQIASQSNDGVSTSYNVLSMQSALDSAKSELKDCVFRYLYGVRNAKGEPLTYRGVGL